MPRLTQIHQAFPEIDVPLLDGPTILRRYPLDGSEAGQGYDSNVVIGFPEGGNLGATEYHEADGSVRYFGVSPSVIVGLRELVKE